MMGENVAFYFNFVTFGIFLGVPGCKEHPIYHKLGSIKVSCVEDLLEL